MLYLLDFGNLGQSDEVILRAAIAGLAPILDIPDDADADFECAEILPFDRPLQAHA